ncbi:hypothetical protein VW921_12025 [Enterococcus faecalis]|uniref:hypothetical protein n=1 Tax=Enterococcus TaxID=1350 RepID=UPI00192659AB|nr:hypothetical protein [Enterococcus faecalis]EIB6804460.1 hypothetical protein [Enterococcus faecalis]EJR1589225.1 hypothetical protein [Enterococcus faecalis]EKK5901926.1 hypothetical protein [Enterococcus faecalis]EKZ0170641.1 hypothetical protein [Enterococcus faecalis]EMD7416638.1 hypothetical protein [Enterococcus faecalis]
MDKANMDEIWRLFQETSFEELTERVNEAEAQEEIRLFKALFKIKLAKRQQEVIKQDKFVM